MPTLSQRALGLQESAIRKLDLVVAQQRGVDFHRLNIGQPDIPTPGALLDVIGGWRPNVVAYGPASGLPSCRAAAAEYESRWSPGGLRAEHVAITAGGSEGILFAFTAMCDPGDEILVPEPYYTNYNGFATVAGATVKPIRTRIEDQFALPADSVLDTFVTPRTRVLVLNSPGNPTGVVYPRSEIERVTRWARRRGLFVVADEVYRRIWFDEPPASCMEVEDCEDVVVCIDSMSKTWSACGLRVGFLISKNAELMEKIERLGQARLGVQPLAQEAAIAALRLPEAYYEDLRATYQGRVYALFDTLEATLGKGAVHRPQGAFYLMVRLPVDDADRFARFPVTDFRHEGQSVVVAPGGGFYTHPADGRDQVRLAAVKDEAGLKRAVELLGRALEAYPGRV